MNRQEAIKILETERDEHINGHGVCYATRQEAVNMAIEALQTEHCEDTISRQAAMKCLEMYGDKKTLDEVFERLSKLPSVTQKVGKWKRVSMDKYVQHAMAYYRCSECGGEIIGTYKYCPECGCRMEEGDAE